jgi:hypothetical protein
MNAGSSQSLSIALGNSDILIFHRETQVACSSIQRVVDVAFKTLAVVKADAGRKCTVAVILRAKPPNRTTRISDPARVHPTRGPPRPHIAKAGERGAEAVRSSLTR